MSATESEPWQKMEDEARTLLGRAVTLQNMALRERKTAFVRAYRELCEKYNMGLVCDDSRGYPRLVLTPGALNENVTDE